MVQNLNAVIKDGKSKTSYNIILEQYRLKQVMTDCCAVAGKAAGRHSPLP